MGTGVVWGFWTAVSGVRDNPLRSDWSSSPPRRSSQDETWDGLWGAVGSGTMLEAGPDVICHLKGMTLRYDMGNRREPLASHSVGQERSPVKFVHEFVLSEFTELLQIVCLSGTSEDSPSVMIDSQSCQRTI